MKKVLSLILTVVLTLSTAAVAFAAGFSDVDENYSWAQEAIDDLSGLGIVTGYEDGTFKPGKSITRQEAITLFSRAMGASEEMNASIVNLAYGIYEGDIAGCTDSYAAKQGAYMIYRKILTPDEVKEYLLADNRNIELKRYEAATLIAKALGADVWLKSNTGYSVTFADKDAIPAQALGYVYYATALGIMNGMGDNQFGPNETVTRAQIAVMISRIIDTMNFEYIRGMISEVNTLHNSVTIKTDDGEEVKFGTGNSSVIYLDGNKVTLLELEAGMECVFTFSNGGLYQIDAITYEGEEVISGAYRSRQTTSAGTTIKVDDITTPETDISGYKLAANAVVTYQGEAASVMDFNSGDYITMKLSGGLVVSVDAEPKESKVGSVTIRDISTSAEGVVITVMTKDEEEISYILADDATFTRNNAKAEFTDLAVGDTAELTLTYRQISSIMAIGKDKSTEGTITEITISQDTSYITIAKNGAKSKYVLSRDCKITLQGEAATIYDLRLGAYVTLTVTSETVTAVKSEAVSEELSVTGTIKTINSSYGLVVISYEGASGETVDKQLFLKSTVKILDNKTGKLLTPKNLAVGNVITAAGTEKLGVYEVSSIMVLQ